MDKILNIKNYNKELLEILKKENIKYKPKDLEKVLDYASNIYGDTKRYKGELTIIHAIHVAEIVASLKIGIEAVYAAILHEIPKFKEYKEEDFKKNIGEEVSMLVIDSMKLSMLNYDSDKQLEVESLRKMFMAIAKDVRVVIIKLADRLYNMRNIYEETEELQIRKAHETMQIYAPIAHRIGMSNIKSEMEDLSFAILNPKDYQWIKQRIELDKEDRQDYINIKIEEIKKVLEKEKIVATIYGRPKYLYSIYKKMRQKNCKVEELYDLYAIRIIVNSVKDCYTSLGIIHEKYKPIPGKFKDYIAVPKTNMYQSLHTTLFGSDEESPFEVQIRTWDMHKIAEYGIAAHFLYKEGKAKMSKSDEMLNWLRKTIELENEIGEGSYQDFKTELFGDEVFVFTPKGEIRSLPKGSTPIDYAYSIHSNIGNKMVGAKINNKMVPIITKLKNTDIVEIITRENAPGPNLDWIKNVKTTSAKNKIVSFLKKQDKQVNITKGKELLDKEINKLEYSKEEVLNEKNIKRLFDKLKFNSMEECYENIGFGVISVKKIINKLTESFEDKIKEKEFLKDIQNVKTSKMNKTNKEGIIVEGIDNCLVKFAKCCNPIPGDDIVGYITYGNGVSIHSKDCPNLHGLNLDQRKINVRWEEKVDVSYETKIIVKANDREGITLDILKSLQEKKLRILGISSKATEDKECIIDVILDVSSTKELQDVIKVIKKVDSVFDVKRAK